MSPLRAVVPALLIATWAWAAEPAPVAPPAPAAATAPVTDALMQLIDTAIAHGFPDGAGATIHRGTLIVVEPTSAGDHLGHQFFSATRTVEREHRRTITVDGLHLKLADGRWVVGCSTVVTPSATVTVDATKSTVIAAAGLREAFPSVQKISADQWAEMEKKVPASELAEIKVIMRWQGLLHAQQFQDGVLSTALFMRAGVPDAAEMMLARNFLGMYRDRLAAPEPLVVRHEDWAQALQRQDQRIQQLRQQMQGGTVPAIPDLPLDTHLRADLVEWFMGELVSDAPVVAPAIAIKALTALSAGDQDAERTAKVAMFIERGALPANVAPEAALAERLAVWVPSLLPKGIDESAVVFAPVLVDQQGQPAGPIPVITATDLPELFTLLSDTRASRWLDGDQPGIPFGGKPTVRTRGENALRAIAHLMGFDPRHLIARDLFVPWTATERAETAKALQAWYQAHGQEPVEGQLLAVITRLPAGSAAALISGRPEAERTSLIAAVVASWAKAQPTGEAAVGFPALLALVGNSAKAPVMAWPVEGEMRLALAIYHDQHGDPAALDALIPELLGDSESHEDESDRHSLLAALAKRPSAERLAKLRILLDDYASPADQALLVAVLEDNWSAWDQDMQALIDGGKPEDNSDQLCTNALGFALLAGLLAERVAVPTSQIMVHERGLQVGRALLQNPHRGEGKPELLKPAADLRWCDVAACSVVGNSRRFRVGNDQPDELEFDVSAPIAERDAQLAALRIAIDPAISAACAAAGLPMPAGGAAPAGSEKSLF